jgi:hypothetical protein
MSVADTAAPERIQQKKGRPGKRERPFLLVVENLLGVCGQGFHFFQAV